MTLLFENFARFHEGAEKSKTATCVLMAKDTTQKTSPFLFARVRSLLLRSNRWFLNALRRIIFLPLPVIRKRLAADFLVFNLGMGYR